MMRYHALPIALLYQRGNILTQMDVSDMRKYESADVWKMAVKLVFVHDACFQLTYHDVDSHKYADNSKIKNKTKAEHS